MAHTCLVYRRPGERGLNSESTLIIKHESVSKTIQQKQVNPFNFHVYPVDYGTIKRGGDGVKQLDEQTGFLGSVFCLMGAHFQL